MLSDTLGRIRHEITTTRDGLQVKDDNLLDPYLIRTMADNEALFLFSNKAPVKLKITRFFENKALLAETKKVPVDLIQRDFIGIKYYKVEAGAEEKESRGKTRGAKQTYER